MSSSSSLRYSLAAAIALGLSLPLEVHAAADYFLELDGIKGETSDSKSKNTIDVLSWSWGMSQEGTGAPCIDELIFEKKFGSASPQLARSLASGATHKFANLSVVQIAPNDEPYVSLLLEMTAVKLTELNWSSDDEAPVERYSMTFSEIHGDYNPPPSQPDPSSGLFTAIAGRCR